MHTDPGIMITKLLTHVAHTHRYEDDELFASALAMLDRTFGQRRTLITKLKAVIMLHR